MSTWRSRRWLKLLVAVLMLAALYAAADWRNVLESLRDLNPAALTWGLLLFVPQTLVSAIRWRMLVSGICRISVLESARQVLIASAYNLLLPSKLGDLSKAMLLPIPRARAIAEGSLRVLAEKLADLLALGAIWFMGALGTGGLPWSLFLTGFFLYLLLKSILTRDARATVWRPPGIIAFLSLLLWTLHLWQIQFFLQAADVASPWPITSAKVPTALFAGLLPISLWGIGTRDVTLVWLYDNAPHASVAAVGLLTSLRYLIPGLCGIPLVTRKGIESVEQAGEAGFAPEADGPSAAPDGAIDVESRPVDDEHGSPDRSSYD